MSNSFSEFYDDLFCAHNSEKSFAIPQLNREEVQFIPIKLNSTTSFIKNRNVLMSTIPVHSASISEDTSTKTFLILRNESCTIFPVYTTFADLYSFEKGNGDDEIAEKKYSMLDRTEKITKDSEECLQWSNNLNCVNVEQANDIFLIYQNNSKWLNQTNTNCSNNKGTNSEYIKQIPSHSSSLEQRERNKEVRIHSSCSLFASSTNAAKRKTILDSRKTLDKITKNILLRNVKSMKRLSTHKPKLLMKKYNTSSHHIFLNNETNARNNNNSQTFFPSSNFMEIEYPNYSFPLSASLKNISKDAFSTGLNVPEDYNVRSTTQCYYSNVESKEYCFEQSNSKIVKQNISYSFSKSQQHHPFFTSKGNIDNFDIDDVCDFCKDICDAIKELETSCDIIKLNQDEKEEGESESKNKKGKINSKGKSKNIYTVSKKSGKGRKGAERTQIKSKNKPDIGRKDEKQRRSCKIASSRTQAKYENCRCKAQQTTYVQYDVSTHVYQPPDKTKCKLRTTEKSATLLTSSMQLQEEFSCLPQSSTEQMCSCKKTRSFFRKREARKANSERYFAAIEDALSNNSYNVEQKSLSILTSSCVQKLIDMLKKNKNELLDEESCSSMKSHKCQKNCFRNSKSEIICQSQLLPRKSQQLCTEQVNAVELQIKYPKKRRHSCECPIIYHEDILEDNTLGYCEIQKNLKNQISSLVLKTPSDFSVLLNSLSRKFGQNIDSVKSKSESEIIESSICLYESTTKYHEQEISSFIEKEKFTNKSCTFTIPQILLEAKCLRKSVETQANCCCHPLMKNYPEYKSELVSQMDESHEDVKCIFRRIDYIVNESKINICSNNSLESWRTEKEQREVQTRYYEENVAPSSTTNSKSSIFYSKPTKHKIIFSQFSPDTGVLINTSELRSRALGSCRLTLNNFDRDILSRALDAYMNKNNSNFF